MPQNSTLKKIIAEAKRIRKAHPKKFVKWTDYVKFASTKIKPVKKAATKKVAKKKSVAGYIVKEQGESSKPPKKKLLVIREPNGTFRHFKKISGIGDFDDRKYIRMFERERIEATGLASQIQALKQLLKQKLTTVQRQKVRASVIHHQNRLRITNKNLRIIKKHL